MGFPIRALALVFLAAVALVTPASAQEQQENIPQENSDAIARKLMTIIRDSQSGDHTPPLWAYEVDFNLDGFSEIYGFVNADNCDGRDCGLFVYVLQGDSYREVLGDVPGARLTATDKVFLGSFKRNGFIDLQLDQKLASWNGDRYTDASTFPASTLDGTAFLNACHKSFSDASQDSQSEAADTCQCQLDRLQATNLQQAALDEYVVYMNNDTQTFHNLSDDAWQTVLTQTDDAVKGCDMASGKTKWEPAYFQHGDQPQNRLALDDFIDACRKQDWIIGNRKVGAPDRALGLCGCLAREIPTYGVDQDSVNLLTRYYSDEVSDAEVDARQADLLELHDKASEACLAQFPAK